MRKFTIWFLIVLCVLTISVGAVAGLEKKAVPSRTKFLMDGKEVAFDVAYNIEDSNYIQLRSVAQLLKGTKSQFNVYWDDDLKQAVIETGVPYTGEKPVIVKKNVYEIGDVVSIKNAEVSIMDVFTISEYQYENGFTYPSPGNVYYGVTFSVLTSEQSWTASNFVGYAKTKNGGVYRSYSQFGDTKIYSNQTTEVTVYYDVDKKDEITEVTVYDRQGYKTISVMEGE